MFLHEVDAFGVCVFELPAQVVAFFLRFLDLGAQGLQVRAPLLQELLELRQLRLRLLELGVFLACGCLDRQS